MSAFWSSGRDRSAESENATASGPRVRSWRLTAVDRGDRCGAQAYVRILLPGRLELLFCAHHNRQYASALANIAVEIQDETIRLACCVLFASRAIPIPGPRITPGELRARPEPFFRLAHPVLDRVLVLHKAFRRVCSCRLPAGNPQRIVEQPLCSSLAARARGVSMTQSCVRVTPMMTIGDGPTRDGRRGLLDLLVEPLRAEGDQGADPERR